MTPADRRTLARGRAALGGWACAAACAAALLIGSAASGQTRPPPAVPPRQTPPPPERVYPGAVDRPLEPPDVLRDDRVNLDSGVQIGLGPHAVALHFPKLKVDDTPTLDVSEGVVISGDVLFRNVRVGYSRQFYRRALPVGSTYNGQPVNFLSVDGDQILATVGWRPAFNLFLGALGGAEYRLIRLKGDSTDPVTKQKVSTNAFTKTETTGLAGVMAEWQVATPFSIQARILRETPGRLIRLDSTIFQLSYLIPF